MNLDSNSAPTTSEQANGENGAGKCAEDVEAAETESSEAHLSLAHIQSYLAQASPRTNCCGFALPVAFERAAPGRWWNPKFDSEVLEGQYRNSSFGHIRLRFRFALLYILIFSLSWFIYFLYLGMHGTIVKWPFLFAFAGFFLITSVLLLITFTNVYKMYTLKLSLAIAIALCTLSLSLVALTTQTSYGRSGAANIADVSQSGHFTICIEILLIIYTVTPLPLYICVIIGVLYSIIFEILNIFLHTSDEFAYPGFLIRILLHVCVHVIGVHIFLMTFVRMRGTFMKVGQSLLVRRQLEMEKQLKEKMIHSVMPPKLASWLMEETGLESETSLRTHNTLHPRNSNPGASDLKSLFRPFNMNSMDNVSILFADIVGFTKMSSNKTAEELVSILNDLFERFDELCQSHGCEKISTLGDCYYCVSGCPEPRPDHAKCCVEMGLGMIDAMQEFDRERGEGVNMRVGVHTGTVLCGIVGTRRFKFDVWSNDVTLANKMESTGMPGRVHISEETKRFLSGCYILEEGEEIFGLKTYFIEGRQLSPSLDNYHLAPTHPVDLKLIISPASSPQSVSPIPISSPINTLFPNIDRRHQKNLSQTPPINPNRLSPNPFHFRLKASSLPSILDSDTECDDKPGGFAVEMDDQSSKSPTSTGSYGKYTIKLKNWKVPKFLRKYSDGPPLTSRKEEILKTQLDKEEGATGIEPVIGNNGYHQVPIVIESQDVRTASICQSNNRLTVDPMPQTSSFDKEIIDIRSYLSQSRSNMPFARSSSYRSQYGRQSSMEPPPVSRARSSTLAAHDLLLRPKDKHAVRPTTLAPSPCPQADDAVSLCPSVNSRKDSGIRSTSRRSSIQHQIFVLNQSAITASHTDIMQHRVSGYYTSSQSTINDSVIPMRTRLPPPLNEKEMESVQKLRKQSDLQLIRCVQDNAKSGVSYFMHPPIYALTLNFKNKDMEREYRATAHRSDEKEEFPPTLATSRYNTSLDILISAFVFLLVSISLFLLYEVNTVWLSCFALFLSIEILSILLCIYRHYVKWKINNEPPSQDLPRLRMSERIFKKLSDWYPWHVSGSLIISLPVLSVLMNFSCAEVTIKIMNGEQSFYIYLLCIALVHYCNFTQTNWLLRNVLVTICAAGFLWLSVVHCPGGLEVSQSSTGIPITVIPMAYLTNNFADEFKLSNFSDASESRDYLTGDPSNMSSFENSNGTNISGELKRFEHELHIRELYIDIALLLILVWFLNREFEISYRLSFYSNIVANKDKSRVQNMRNQADWLLHNIIPRHVADHLKNTAKYSENHKDAGIIFASIVNFNEMYDESYLGGKEYLRVLNELIADFDELLEKPEFRAVEKIKTIGSTFMAASGLNPLVRQESDEEHHHLFALMDFATEMQKVIDNFNRDLLEFNLILRIGYNYGDVTAGVIGTTKLYYDIWGDAVNIASRMDSTGVNGRIQVGEACIHVLSKVYDFEPRGTVFVKGKDNMNVYLLIGKRQNP